MRLPARKNRRKLPRHNSLLLIWVVASSHSLHHRIIAYFILINNHLHTKPITKLKQDTVPGALFILTYSIPAFGYKSNINSCRWNSSKPNGTHSMLSICIVPDVVIVNWVLIISMKSRASPDRLSNLTEQKNRRNPIEVGWLHNAAYHSSFPAVLFLNSNFIIFQSNMKNHFLIFAGLHGNSTNNFFS